MDAQAQDALIASFEQAGEDQVRRTLSRNAYNEERTKIALAWLESRDDTREARRSRDTLRIAKSANVAAWLAVILTVIGIGVTAAAWLLPRS